MRVDRWFVSGMQNGCVKVYDIKKEYDSIVIGKEFPDRFGNAYGIAEMMNQNLQYGRYVPQEPTSKE